MADGEEADSAMLASGLVDRSKLDPRSFLAKSVLQRMAIISAGVIFNLIFAVIFAAVAFKMGVDYEPPYIGNVVGGGPAWEHDVSGAELVAIGDSKVEGYYTRTDMQQEIVFNGDDKPLMFEMIRYGDEQASTVGITPRRGFIRQAPDLPLIGVAPRLSPVIGKMGAVDGSAAASADPPFESGDRIIKVNNHSIETDIDLRRALELDADMNATFVLERKKDKDDDSVETVTTTIPTNPMRTLGFAVEWLPVAAIKIGSPAEKAEIKIGDEILTIDGEPRGDLLTLDKRMIQIIRDGGSVTLGIKRDGRTQDVSITPVVPKLIADVGPTSRLRLIRWALRFRLTGRWSRLNQAAPHTRLACKRETNCCQLSICLTTNK